MNKRKEDKAIDLQDYPLDSRYRSDKERLREGEALMEARLEQLKKVPEDQILKARLLQLKYQMEDYLSGEGQGEGKSFLFFLVTYIDALYSRRSSFAEDMNISPVALSHVLNGHRDPKLEFLQRLMIHSDLVYRNISSFKNTTWFQVYYQGKIQDAFSKISRWSTVEAMHVNISEPMERYGKLLGSS